MKLLTTIGYCVFGTRNIRFNLFVIVAIMGFFQFSAIAQPATWTDKELSQRNEQIGSDNPVLHDKMSSRERISDHLTIISDSKLDTLLQVYSNERNRKGTIEGYRVQIFTGKKDDAYNLKSRFLAKYPDYEVHIRFISPDFYVRVGDCRSRSEAIKLKFIIQKEYPDPFIVEDLIELPKLLGNIY
jgi:hypothetical protein